jgi:hypothetical protein
MKLYSVLLKKNNYNEIEDLALLKDGFSFSAFCFGALWFLYHRMWREFVVVIMVNLLIVFLPLFTSSDKLILSLGISFIIAFNANYWRSEFLSKKKYQFFGVFFGKDCEDARLAAVNSLGSGSKFIL